MADEASSKPIHLEPSELGTKQYWDDLYTTELTNHASNPADEGTVWFDDSDAETRMIEFLASHSLAAPNSSSSATLRLDPTSARALDLGCGNGSLLFALRDVGWSGRLLGVDYSELSVALARQIQATRGATAAEGAEQEEEDDDDDDDDDGDEEEAGGKGGKLGEKSNRPVEFEVWDILNGALEAVAADQGVAEGDGSAGWDIVLDKGTFDAVSLSGERNAAGRRVSEGYRSRVLGLLREGGIFLVTSCNWTEAELEEWFVPSSTPGSAGGDGSRLERVGHVQYRTFSFGGVKGQTISTLCFQKKA